MVDEQQPIGAVLLSCAVCCAEVPISAALSAEGTEYVLHFCGSACYAKFCARAIVQTSEQSTREAGDPDIDRE